MRNLSVIKGLYQGNGVTRRWAIPFEYNDTAQIFVTITTYDEGDYTYRVLDRTEYTIDEDSVEIVYPKTDDDAPIPSTQYLTVWRDTDLLQLMDLTNQGAAWPDSIEASLDKLHQIVQELAEGLSRSLKVDIGDPQTPDEKLVAIQDYVLAAAESSRSASASEASAQRAAEAAATSEENTAESERLASGYADTATAAAGRAEDSAISARAYNAPDYDNAVTYQAGDVVTYSDGNSYRALQETTGNEPPNIIYWQKVTDYVGDDFFEVDEYGYIVPMDSPSHSRYWRVDQNGYIVPIEGGDGGYRPDTRSLSAEYLNVTNEGYIKHLRADDINAGNLSATGNVTAGMVTTPQANVTTLTANAVNAGTLTADDIIAKGPIVDVRAFGAVGDGVHDDTTAFEAAISAAENNSLFIPNGNYKINSTLIANKAKTVINNGDYTGVEPIYPIGDNLSKMALNLTPEIQINYPSAAEPTSTVSYYCQSVGYCPDTDHVLLVFAGYTIATGANDQPGKVVEMTADYQTVINSATVDVGHGNGCCYCSKDGKWYIATGTGIISLNSDLSLNSTHLTGSGWAVEYSSDKDVFYVQIGDTGSDNNGKVNIYSFDWELLSQTTLERVKNRYKTGYLTSQDATLINGDYVFLYYGAQDISLTTYDMLTGKIKEHAIFDNIAGREPEGVYVKDNCLYILSVTSNNLLIYSVLLNNVATPTNKKYGIGQILHTDNLIKSGYFTTGATQFWCDFIVPDITDSVSRILVTVDDITIRQQGNYIVLNGTSSTYSIGTIYLDKSTKTCVAVISKKDGTAFANAVNNAEAVLFGKFTLEFA